MEFELEPVKAVETGVIKKREVEHNGVWIGFWTCCRKYWRQRAALENGLMEIPQNDTQVKKEHKFKVTAVAVLRKLKSHYRALKNKKHIRKIWKVYNTDDDEHINHEEMIEIFLDGLTIWKKEQALRELRGRWSENVTSGHGRIEKSDEFEEIYKNIEDGVFKAIVDNLNIFIEQVKTNIGKLDKENDDDSEIDKEGFGKKLREMMEILCEWYNESCIKEVENELGEMQEFAYRAPKVKTIWLESARQNEAAREKIFVFYWKSLLYDWEQIEDVSIGMRGLDIAFQKTIRSAVIDAQYRHRGAQALRSVWRCFKEDGEKEMKAPEFIKALTEAISAWTKLAPSTAARKWSDRRNKTSEDKKKFKHQYFEAQTAYVDDASKDPKKIAADIVKGKDSILKSEFKDQFQTVVTKYIIDMHSNARLAGEEAVDGPRKKKEEPETKEGKDTDAKAEE